MQIEQALHQYLKANNYPIAQFARDIGIARSHLYKILHGTHSPTLHTVERMSTALDMTLAEFIAMIESPVAVDSVTTQVPVSNRKEH
ncbi:MAG: helix-turn-helix domain-containing protein [Sphaerochaetaceae bacterium]|jgi:DNA-binding phage protein|nr:MAG: hypothetical protein A2Y31_05435 [Spirochaetes bacterium GWC2_52_13]OHD62053.1 MAG: hypothetical protein A2101_02125 [Spirochaetes bacterium GWF2_52_7]PKL03216.1 MAG: hypothetical protein CVV53_10005 [Spirochaetae bacterium HGW-Spirochaetae-9]HCG63918.1 hypothetical protein [Sphaerochaeta sp.]HCS37217.1 hypothetical protein [Sphaerochaeta sp.]